MKPQSVLTRVKMFENKRSASLENKKDVNDTASFKVSVSRLYCLARIGTVSAEQIRMLPSSSAPSLKPLCNDLFLGHLCLIFAASRSSI
jgi:hypothetical protein